MTQFSTRAPDMQVNTDHISKKLTEAGFTDPRTKYVLRSRDSRGMPKAYPDSETTKTRCAVRKRTGVFRTRHAAKDRGGE
jgi:hypothetical protein